MTLKKTWETEGCGKASHKAIPCTCQKKCHHIYPLPQKAEDEGQVSAWGVETGSQERRGGQMPVGSATREREKKKHLTNLFTTSPTFITVSKWKAVKSQNKHSQFFLNPSDNIGKICAFYGLRAQPFNYVFALSCPRPFFSSKINISSSNGAIYLG